MSALWEANCIIFEGITGESTERAQANATQTSDYSSLVVTHFWVQQSQFSSTSVMLRKPVLVII